MLPITLKDIQFLLKTQLKAETLFKTTWLLTHIDHGVC
jgi:hypothetical protein